MENIKDMSIKDMLEVLRMITAKTPFDCNTLIDELENRVEFLEKNQRKPRTKKAK